VRRNWARSAPTPELVHRPDRTIEEAIRHARRRADFLATHRGQLVDPLAEFGAGGILCQKVGHEGFGTGFELVARVLGHGNEPGGLLGRNHGHRLGRGQLDPGAERGGVLAMGGLLIRAVGCVWRQRWRRGRVVQAVLAK
jgi:hypothetical protein